jgi:hypothetical protein
VARQVILFGSAATDEMTKDSDIRTSRSRFSFPTYAGMLG